MRKIYLLLSFLISFSNFGQTFSPSDIDPTFNNFNFPENHYYVDNVVKKLKILPDDKILVLEHNTLVKLQGNILDLDFSTGTGFQSDSEGNVILSDFAVQPDGKILVCGYFSSYKGQNRTRIVRLNPDGSLDSTFNFQTYSYFYDISRVFLQNDGKILVFGQYSTYTPSQSNLIRLNTDGTLDTSFIIPSTYFVKNLVVQPDDKIVVAYGDNDAGDNKVRRFNYDGSIDTSFALANFFIYSSGGVKIAKLNVQDDGKILVGGKFAKCNTTIIMDLVRLNANGSVDETFQSIGFDYSGSSGGYNSDIVSDILIQDDNKIIVSGNFDLNDKYKIVRLNEDGSKDTTFINGSAFINIMNITFIDLFSDGKILAGGDSVGGFFGYNAYDSYLVKLNTDGTRDASFNNKGKGFYSDYWVRTIKETADGKILVGGRFHTYNDAKCYSLARLDQNGNLDTTLNYGGLNGFEGEFHPMVDVFAEKEDGKIYVGGIFNSYSGQVANNLMRINPDGTRDNTFVNNTFGLQPVIKAILPKPDGGIFVGGSFTKFNNLNYEGLVSLSSTGMLVGYYNSWTPVSHVTCLKYQGTNKILVGLSLETSNYTYGGMKRFNLDLTLDPTFVLDPLLVNATVNSFEIQQDGKIIINGKFSINGESKSIARVLENGALDTSFDFTQQNYNQIVHDATLLPDQKILVSLEYLNSGRSQLIRLNANGSVDESFADVMYDSYNEFKSKTTSNGKILLYGSIKDYKGQRVGGITRLMGENYYFVSGQNRLDLNGNGCGIEDDVFSNLKFHVTGATDNSFDFVTNTSGNFNMGLTAGNYTVTPTFENPGYFSISPSNLSLNFPIEDSPALQNFCVTPLGIHPDIEVTLLPLEVARPGFDVEYKIILKNKGNQIQSGTINLDYADAIMDFVSAQPIISNQSTNNLTWDFASLKPFETREIVFKMNLNAPTEEPPVTDETLLLYTVNAITSLTDETPDDNTFILNQEVVNSFDPNDKTCLEGSSISDTKVGEYVHYLIRFENTGTYQAQNIKVKDVIDTTKFDIATLVPLSGSHSFVTRIYDGNRVEFFFENINLPFQDDINDGYVLFKIKTNSSLADGDTFSNSAAIYFDYNAPIITNNETTMIQGPLANEEFISKEVVLTIYPNPVESILNMSVTKDVNINSISIYNILGQLMIILPNGKNIEAIDVSGLSSGNYILKIDAGTKTVSSKFIKL